MEWRVRWFGWWSDVARPRPVESKHGVPTYSVEEVEVLCFPFGRDVWSINVAFFVVAIREVVALGKPPCAHPTLVVPLGPVLGVLAR